MPHTTRRALAALALAALLAACGGRGAAEGGAPATQPPATVAAEQATAAPPAETPTAQPAAPAATEAPAVEPTTAPAMPAATEAPTAVPTAAPAAAGAIRLEQVAGDFSQPLFVTHAGDGSGRLFVVEKAGVVKIVRGGEVAAQPFLDLTDRVGSSGSEQGLLSIAFHPRFRENGLLYVDYTDKDGDTVVSRLTAEGDRADPGSEKVLLQVDQPYANHNGGLLMFGPDGMLYIGLGDGGSGGDPQDRAQNTDELLGKILRIDVDRGDPYGIPAGNPFADRGGRPEIWALGLRNPWRFSFDRATGELYIGDVGQNKWEEIDLQPPGKAGVNYGWNLVEASHCYKDGCAPEDFALPIAEYPHEQGCSVTGGFVYRGAAEPSLVGTYFYADYCNGTIWSLGRDGAAWRSEVALETEAQISSFGEDEAGELYLTDIKGGALYRVAAGKD